MIRPKTQNKNVGAGSGGILPAFFRSASAIINAFVGAGLAPPGVNTTAAYPTGTIYDVAPRSQGAGTRTDAMPAAVAA
jgi:hypothetical protein